ncbi:oligopeptide ABC transporter permease OppB [Gynuella sunshinyii]|nr:oligopeptide ABC transporter permease OppB [Gynuella sunshinyii]
MINFILRRLMVAIPTLLVLIVVSFLIMHAAPGSPFSSEKPLPPAVKANIEKKYGLDKPLYVQITNYITNVVTRFDFGPSFRYKDQNVNDLIAEGFPVTLKYGSIAFFLALIIGVSIGIFAALKQNSWQDYSTQGFAIVGQVLPNFVMAPILVLVFTLTLGWLPGGGWEGGQLKFMVLPVIALATSYMASIARITRSSMIEVLHSNFIRTARAKGLPFRYIIFRHALKPALLPVVSYLGPTFVAMVTGSVIVDSFFSTGGIGIHFVNSALNRDYSVLMGVTILLGALTILFSTVVDIMYAWIDPKIRY